MVQWNAERPMKPIEKDELYQNLNSFLKTRGIELTDGSYANGIQKTCSLLADAINLGQQGFERAKTQFDKRLDQMRQVIHEKTAPPSSTQAAPPPATAAPTETAVSSEPTSGSTTSSTKKRHTKAAKHSKSRRRRS